MILCLHKRAVRVWNCRTQTSETMCLHSQLNTLVCPTHVRMEGHARKPVRVTSVSVQSAGAAHHAKSVRRHTNSNPNRRCQTTLDVSNLLCSHRCGRLYAKPMQTRRHLSGFGQWLQMYLPFSLDRQNVSDWWEITSSFNYIFFLNVCMLLTYSQKLFLKMPMNVRTSHVWMPSHATIWLVAISASVSLAGWVRIVTKVSISMVFF